MSLSQECKKNPRAVILLPSSVSHISFPSKNTQFFFKKKSSFHEGARKPFSTSSGELFFDTGARRAILKLFFDRLRLPFIYLTSPPQAWFLWRGAQPARKREEEKELKSDSPTTPAFPSWFSRENGDLSYVGRAGNCCECVPSGQP